MRLRVIVALALVSVAGSISAPFVDRAHADGGTVSGTSGIRPFLGVTSHLPIDDPTALGGTKFLFGADYYFGEGVGFTGVAGFRVGAGGTALLLQPSIELHYRFGAGYPLVPYVGAGLSPRAAVSQSKGFNFGVGVRFVAGVEYYAAEWVAVGAQFTLPDVGVSLVPSPVRLLGTLEVLIGPHFRF